MSGWIKMGVGLRRHPKVVCMASALKADRLRVVGALHAVWCVFDEHSQDGALAGYTTAVMDEEIGWRGFCAAMASVGWLGVCADGGLAVPDYEEHNGPTAKRRATETKRKAEARADDEDDRTKSQRIADDARTKSGQTSASDADTLRAREEKRRREEETTPPNSRKRGPNVSGFPPGFDRFWEAYPRKIGKDAAAKAFAKRRPDAALLSAMLSAIATQRSSAPWQREGGQFIPHPTTWLNEGRWQDETAPEAVSSAFAGAH